MAPVLSKLSNDGDDCGSNEAGVGASGTEDSSDDESGEDTGGSARTHSSGDEDDHGETTPSSTRSSASSESDEDAAGSSQTLNGVYLPSDFSDCSSTSSTSSDWSPDPKRPRKMPARLLDRLKGGLDRARYYSAREFQSMLATAQPEDLRDRDWGPWVEKATLKAYESFYRKKDPIAAKKMAQRLRESSRFKDACREVRVTIKKTNPTPEPWRIQQICRTLMSRSFLPRVPLHQRKKSSPNDYINIEFVPCPHIMCPKQDVVGTALLKEVVEYRQGHRIKRVKPIEMPQNTCRAGRMPHKLRRGNCALSTSIFTLQRLASERRWQAYHSLTKDAQGPVRNFVDLLWASSGRWTIELERLRAEIIILWKPRLELHDPQIALRWAEDVFCMNTLLAAHLTCDMCGERVEEAKNKNIDNKEAAKLRKFDYMDSAVACEPCEEVSHHLTNYVLTKGAVLLAHRRGERYFENISAAESIIPSTQSWGGKTFRRFSSSITLRYNSADRPAHEVLALWEKNGRVLQVSDGDETYFGKTWVDGADVLGFNPNYTVYVEV